MHLSYGGTSYLFTGQIEQIDTDLDWYLRCIEVETGKATWISRYDISASERAAEIDGLGSRVEDEPSA
jgi:hypothetical protein